MAFLSPKAPQVITQAAPQPPPVPPLAVAADTRPRKKPVAPTFMSAEATPTATALGGGKGSGLTLLGQA